MYYAQLTNGVVTSMTETYGPLPASPNLVPIGSYDMTLMGNTYDGAAFHAPVVIAPVDPCQWLIDIGPFYDRFGSAKMSVLTSPDPSLKAVLTDINIRKWIDLKLPSVAQGLAYVGAVVAAVTPALQSAILTTPLAA